MMKTISIALLAVLATSIAYADAQTMCNSINASPPSIIFQLTSNTSTNMTANMVIHNNSSLPLENYTLYFNYFRQGLTVSTPNVNLQDPEGDYYSFSGSGINVPANGDTTLQVTVGNELFNYTDFPNGYFIVAHPDPKNPAIACPPVDLQASNHFNAPYAPTADQVVYNQNLAKQTAVIEGHASEAYVPANNPLNHIIPQPVWTNPNNTTFTLSANTLVVNETGDANVDADIAMFNQEIRPATNFNLNITTSAPTGTSNNQIVISYQVPTIANVVNPNLLGQEGYYLNITTNSIQIFANNDAGVFYALQTLRQLLPAQIMSQTVESNVTWTIPGGQIVDYPRFAYRGMQLDTARHFIAPEQVEMLLDQMAMYKLNYFDWHLSDDEGFRMQLPNMPELNTVGSYRGYDPLLPLKPTLGSGSVAYGGYFSDNDSNSISMQDIIAYAKARHITIIPEIEMPGHARAMVKSMLSSFEDPDDQSQYTSVQGYHDNVVSPCVAGTTQALGQIFGAMSQIFADSPYISIGGDEVPTGAWMGSPACKAFMPTVGIDPNSPTAEQQLFNYFIASEVQPLLTASGKKMAGWQDIIGDDINTNGQLPANQKVGTSAVAFMWNEMQNNPAGQQNFTNQIITATRLGYDVVLAPAATLYFDLAYSANPNEIGQNWAGYVDDFAIYSYDPINEDVATHADLSHILGIQGELWTERVPSPETMEYLAFPKLAALAEVAWSEPQERDWNDFSYRLTTSYLPHLDAEGILYRISPPGAIVENGQVFANVEFTTNLVNQDGNHVMNFNPEYTIHYTTDGSAPNVNSPFYTGPLPAGPNYQFATCIPTGRCSYTVTPVVSSVQ